MKPEQLILNLQPVPIHRYAVLDQLPFDNEELLSSAASRSRNNSNLDPNVAAHVDETKKLAAWYSKPSGNPYANVESPTETPEVQLKKNVVDRAITQVEFTREARRILRQYSPSVGRARRLRPEFRQFIDKGSKSTPAARGEILDKLRTYDLEASGYGVPLFNRELSDRMLKRLEKLLD